MRAMGRRRGAVCIVAVWLWAGALASAAAEQPHTAAVLWRDPAQVEPLPAPPRPPFTFVREDLSGTQPKLFARDAAGRTWNVKFGYEVKTESFCWRVVRACGNFVEPSFYVAEGRLEAFRGMRRAAPGLSPDGRFRSARFQLRDPNLRFLASRYWRWDRRPWAGTKELSGLKILIMLFSNWDNKDARAGKGGPNTGIFERRENGATEHLYAFTDWGSGLGRWGPASRRTNWKCEDYAAQTPAFVKRTGDGVEFAWEGAINEGFRDGIPAEHVAWLLRYLGRVTDAQLRTGLKESGASDAEAECFANAIRARIEQLSAVAR
jgi:hypothetical protein